MEIQSRNTAFHRPTVVRLRDDCIDRVRDGRVVDSIPLSGVSQVNLALLGASHAGAGAVPAYRCRVKDERGQSIEFRNVAYVGLGEVASQDEPYLAMVRELHARLVPRRWDIRFARGSNAFYALGWMGLLFSALLLLAIPSLLLIEGGLLILFRKAWVIALVPVLTASCFLPLVRRGPSRPYEPSELPIEHLPAANRVRCDSSLRTPKIVDDDVRGGLG